GSKERWFWKAKVVRTGPAGLVAGSGCIRVQNCSSEHRLLLCRPQKESSPECAFPI
ncbi:hypothetical protein AMECASPLE_036412, partial [Ameca splendens]